MFCQSLLSNLSVLLKLCYQLYSVWARCICTHCISSSIWQVLEKSHSTQTQAYIQECEVSADSAADSSADLVADSKLLEY